jgi:D-arabinose 1-dehydrogenase-like Zn-dependent alcohol dehydrogenase
VVGIIDELGAGVAAWDNGQRVGVGWHGGQDNTCPSCRRGDFRNCRNLRIPGISYDGGYQQYMIAPSAGGGTGKPRWRRTSPAALRRNYHLQRAAAQRGAWRPCRCAGHRRSGSPWNSIRNKFGYNVATIGRRPEDTALAKKLGARVYIDNKMTNPVEALQKLGGAKVILATAPSSKTTSELFDGLAPNGKLMVIGVSFDPIEVTPVQLISGSRTIQGWAAGTPADSEDTLRFAELTGVRLLVETYPLEKAADAYERMLSGKAQFRVVLTM